MEFTQVLMVDFTRPFELQESSSVACRAVGLHVSILLDARVKLRFDWNFGITKLRKTKCFLIKPTRQLLYKLDSACRGSVQNGTRNVMHSMVVSRVHGMK